MCDIHCAELSLSHIYCCNHFTKKRFQNAIMLMYACNVGGKLYLWMWIRCVFVLKFIRAKQQNVDLYSKLACILMKLRHMSAFLHTIDDELKMCIHWKFHSVSESSNLREKPLGGCFGHVLKTKFYSLKDQSVEIAQVNLFLLLYKTFEREDFFIFLS